ncbi:NADH-dependent [FeFe] hydrogenase, group A6 [Halocella sp. SP3-1]|uniref:NADH-dependent [FeFe] hydrogenase, group A6 n=1 Tax=Halocella sp. SP3-1 TaxID=2382161 RepID=UPI000F753A64|nr:NADH-dependent [FeFe] hydrogenase, group A6 [Halocella sp. SP3-1]AZO96233.1 ferredoxin [Halocella sp. SP3-1]
MTDNKIKLWIDEEELEVDQGTTLLEAAKMAGRDIPTLCYLKELNEVGACRLCLVELEDSGKLVASCITPAVDGMRVKTNTARVRKTRRLNLEFLLSNHKVDCPTCLKSDDCELRELAEQMGIRDIRFIGEKSTFTKDVSTPSLYRDPEKCILCRRCVSVCHEVQSVKAIVPEGRGFKTVVEPAFYNSLSESPCVLCGQCSVVCPTGAITEREYIDDVWEAIYDPSKHVIVQTAPAVRVALSEAFGKEPGTIVTGQMVSALRELGFDKVFDTNFTADLTIMEEGTELIDRIKNNETLPLFTSCSPGWIKFLEHYYPEFIYNLSTCKSPQQMFGSVAKTYYAEKNDISVDDLVVVSIMPCTAKKFEASRSEMNGDVDYALTTRELGRMIKQAGIDILNLPEGDYDKLLGVSSGAADIFGTTGGVMEAALRTAYEILTGEELRELDFTQVRGADGIKEAEVAIADLTLKVAVAHGLGNARELLERIKDGAEYHFVEFMACPGGCIGGGGQPLPATEDNIAKRRAGLYEIDQNKEIRKSHENPYIKKIYDEYLEKPGSHKSHELLHTHYVVRGV